MGTDWAVDELDEDGEGADAPWVDPIGLSEPCSLLLLRVLGSKVDRSLGDEGAGTATLPTVIDLDAFDVPWISLARPFGLLDTDGRWTSVPCEVRRGRNRSGSVVRRPWTEGSGRDRDSSEDR